MSAATRITMMVLGGIGLISLVALGILILVPPASFVAWVVALAIVLAIVVVVEVVLLVVLSRREESEPIATTSDRAHAGRGPHPGPAAPVPLTPRGFGDEGDEDIIETVPVDERQ